MKYIYKAMFLILICFFLTSCDSEETVRDIIVHDIIGVPVSVEEVNDTNIFIDGAYTKYRGGEEAKVFFDKYVNLSGHKDVSFNYRYSERSMSPKRGIYLRNKSGFVVDVYYEESAFYSVAHSIISDTDEDIKYENDLSPAYSFRITKIINEDLSEKSLCSVMFDARHCTIRYVFVYDIYDEDFVRGYDDRDSDIEFLLQCLMPSLKWNSLGLSLQEDPDDWIFDYSDIIDIESSEESKVE